MTTTIQAVFENGVFRPLAPLSLPEGQQVQVVIAAEEIRAENAASILAEIASMPVEGGGDPFTSRDHDKSSMAGLLAMLSSIRRFGSVVRGGLFLGMRITGKPRSGSGKNENPLVTKDYLSTKRSRFFERVERNSGAIASGKPDSSVVD